MAGLTQPDYSSRGSSRGYVNTFETAEAIDVRRATRPNYARYPTLCNTPNTLNAAHRRDFVSRANKTDNGTTETQAAFQLGREKGGVQKKSGTISRANDQNSGAQFSAQTTQNRAQFNARIFRFKNAFTRERPKRGPGTILWAINDNVGTNLRAFYKHFYIGCLKTQKQQLNFVEKKKLLIYIYFFQFGQGAV